MRGCSQTQAAALTANHSKTTSTAPALLLGFTPFAAIHSQYCPTKSRTKSTGQSRTSGHVLQAHVKKLRLLGSEAHLDVAQRFAPSPLGKRHHAKHIGTTECANASVAVVAFHDATKRIPWDLPQDLCKQRLAGVHAVPQVVQTCEHRKYANRAVSSTRIKQ